MGWVTLVQRTDGWLVTNAPVSAIDSKRKRTLQVGDFITKIDGQNTANIGPLTFAAMLHDVPFRSVPMTLRRNGDTIEVAVFGEGVLTDGSTMAMPSYSQDLLQARSDRAPHFALPDLNGKVHALNEYRGRWLLLNVWGTWCGGCQHEIPALKYLSERYPDKLVVVGIAINDTLDTLTKFVEEKKLSYPVLLGGSFEGEFARTYNVHGAPTNIVVSPTGQVVFVGNGPMSLKGAVETIAGLTGH